MEKNYKKYLFKRHNNDDGSDEENLVEGKSDAATEKISISKNYNKKEPEENTRNVVVDNDLEIFEEENVIEDDPKLWPNKKKASIMFLVSISGMIAPIANTIFFPAIIKVRDELKTTQLRVNWIISMFILFMGIAPLFWASYSDAYGTRQRVYIVSLSMFVISSAYCVYATTFEEILILRIIQACGSSAVICVGVGTLSDLYIPTGGPVIGGFITDYFGWRYIFWFLTIFGTIMLVLIYYLLPETFRFKRSEIIRAASSRKIFNPLAPLGMMCYVNVVFILGYKIFVTSIVYVQNILIPTKFTANYKLTSTLVGLVFLAPGAGLMFGSVIGGKWSDYVLKKAIQKNNGVAYPEMRIFSSWVGVILIPLSYLIYGWLLEAKVHIVFPLIFMFSGGFGTMIAFNSLTTYLVDSYPSRSASVIALNNFLRSVLAGGMSAIAQPIETAIGSGFTFTIIVSINVITISLLIAIYKKGKYWREKQDIAEH
ncbi:34_t:CDS:2 [Entrophospora sp. SA101]|nr:34_t:CDS:2 [Entrophospora sp. SA101]